MTVKNI